MKDRSHLFFVFILLAVWAIMTLVANPTGDFPLNDDWMYARTSFFLHNQHVFKISDQYSPILVAQTCWGALFCVPFGFSFMALRISSIVLGLAASVFFYLLVYKLSRNKVIALLCALLIMGNPIFFCLSNSFMSDVPFLSWIIIAVYFYYRVIEKQNAISWILAITAAICATFTRQFGVIIPIAFAIAGVFYKKQSFSKWMIYLLPAIVITGLLFCTIKYLTGIGYVPYEGNDVKSFLFSLVFFQKIFSRCGWIMYYSGFFLFPLLVFFKNPFTGVSPKQKKFVLIFILLFIPSLIVTWPKLPFGNIFNIISLGPHTLKGGFERENLPWIFPKVVDILKCIAFAGAVWLLANIGAVCVKMANAYRAGHVNNGFKLRAFILLCIIGYAFLSFIPDAFFDRYILFFIPMFILVIIPEPENNNLSFKWPVKVVSCFVLFLFVYYSATGTHDYFSWNRARWKSLHYLKDECKISPHKIDGGYEFNGWYIGIWYGDGVNHQKSWWYVDDDEYIVGFTKFPGYQVIKEPTYEKYFPLFSTDTLYVSHRQ